MPEYARFNPKETHLYRGRRNRLIAGACDIDGCKVQDAADAMYNTIQLVDPNLDHAFTPEIVEEIYRKELIGNIISILKKYLRWKGVEERRVAALGQAFRREVKGFRNYSPPP